MRNFTKPALFALALCAAAQAAEPAFVVKEVTGEAAITGGDTGKAFADAKARAMRDAVEQVMGTMISSDTLTANSQLISDRIYANTAGYLRNVEVLSKKEERGVMKVTLRAEVGTAELDKDLQAVKAMIARFGHPKLIILTQEHAVDQAGKMISSGVLSAVLTDSFSADGWTIIDPNFAGNGKLRLAAGVTLGAPEVKEIGQISKADYILYGTAAFHYHASPFTTALAPADHFPVTGEYDFALFATDTGEQLGKIAGRLTTEGKGISPVISYERTAQDVSKVQGGKLVAEMRAKVLERMRGAEQNGSRVTMTVSGLADFGAAQAFVKVLEETSGVRDARRSGFGAGKAQYELVLVGSTGDLAERLDAHKFKGQKISVTGVNGSTVELSLGQ